ncbi:MAG TPA: hypothetical protein VD968_00050, partial [Pyrinomonadaceae bacterium]|nr:hypothetical protein [Pyrinomonadaceae bacterium]
MKAQPSPAEVAPEDDRGVLFKSVYRDEWEEINERRHQQLYLSPNKARGREDAPPMNLVGLALSGGGIRSATFCLGLLQGLHKLRLLRIFDYLSTVSGGGYVGGWWSAWLSRDQISSRAHAPSQGDDDVKVLPEDIKSPVSLMIKLRGSGDDVSIALRERFSPEMKLLLATFNESDPTQRQLDEARAALAAELNRAIDDRLFSTLRYGAPRDGDTQSPLHTPEANRLILEETYPCELKDIFPPREQIEPERFAAGAPEEGGGRPAGDGGGSESSMNAWRDPIHHLRLFANYLTPRRGLLSYDTWRAVSVITRNLTLTWLVLLPVLTAVMLFGQLFFLVAPSTRDDFLPKPPQAQAHRNTGEVFANRLKLIAMPVAGIAGLIGVLWIAWLLCLN